jgi:hypothetical protein
MTEKDDFITEVIFRKDKAKDGGVYAMFPYLQGTYEFGSVMGFMHVGQHSSYDYTYCISRSKPATEVEYKDLKAELESIGYNLKVVNKQNNDKYRKVYNEMRNRK